MLVRTIRNAIKDLPDNAAIILRMDSCPSDDLSVVLETVAPSKDNEYLSIHVSVVDNEDRDDDSDESVIDDDDKEAV